MQALSVMWFTYSWFGNACAYVTSVKVVRIESGSFLASSCHRVVGILDHFILSSLTSEKQSCDVGLHCHRQIGTS